MTFPYCQPLAFGSGVGMRIQTAYRKSIAVTKDGQGQIIQTVETETVTQPGQGYQMKLEKIKGIQP